MIAAVMLYSLAISTLLGVAAAACEYFLRLARRPARIVWMAAMLAALGFSVARFQSGLAAPALSVDTAVASPEVSDVAATEPLAAAPSTPVAGTPSPVTFRGARALLARANAARILIASGSTVTKLDEPLLVCWFALSLVGLIVVSVSAFRLARPRPRWSPTMVDGVPVLLSHDLGPAAIGVFRYRIVLPAWALELPPVERDLVLAHEREHAAAGDPSLLFVSTTLIALCPWNAPLWWMARRLRFAIELDCDARVLRRRPDRRAYGSLLLAVSERTYGGAMPIVALAEPVSLVERRIAAIMSHVPRFARVRAAFAGSVAVTLIVAACVAPRPASAPFRSLSMNNPSRSSATPPAPTPADASISQTTNPVTESLASARIPAARLTPALSDVALARVETIPAVGGGRGRGGSASTQEDQVERIYRFLFAGIAITPDQEAKARSLFTALEQQQFSLMLLQTQALAASLPKRQALLAQRDSALRELLTNDADRAALDMRLTPVGGGAGGARGRSGGPGTDPAIGGGRGGGGGGGARVGGAGGGGGRGARVGGGGAGNDAIPAIADATFHRLFDGIALTPEQESRARAIITSAQQDVQPLTALPFPPFLSAAGMTTQRTDPVSGITVTTTNIIFVNMRAESVAALMSIVTNDADRAALQSRIHIVAQPG